MSGLTVNIKLMDYSEWRAIILSNPREIREDDLGFIGQYDYSKHEMVFAQDFFELIHSGSIPLYFWNYRKYGDVYVAKVVV